MAELLLFFGFAGTVPGLRLLAHKLNLVFRLLESCTHIFPACGEYGGLGTGIQPGVQNLEQSSSIRLQSSTYLQFSLPRTPSRSGTI